jgi:hypothetical protein
MWSRPRTGMKMAGIRQGEDHAWPGKVWGMVLAHLGFHFEGWTHWRGRRWWFLAVSWIYRRLCSSSGTEDAETWQPASRDPSAAPWRGGGRLRLVRGGPNRELVMEDNNGGRRLCCVHVRTNAQFICSSVN